jgi:NAD(P)-dependent dehydrogenase (short-subunit alcohol dehydrogenase family)
VTDTPRAGDLGLRGAVVVTGGGSGIGRAAAIACAAHGADVAVLDRDGGAAEAAARAARGAGGGTAVGLACDVRDEAAVAEAVGAGVERLGHLRGLVACAGVGDGGREHELPLAVWENVVATNLTGTFLACKHVLARMVEHGEGGAIVCASSPWAHVSAPGGASAYSATKGGVSALVRSLALDYARHGVRVNAIVPGATETPLMWAGVEPDEVPAARARIAADLALGRLAEPDDIARGIVWLLSDQAAYATGSELVIDGGLLARASIES